ncbi:MAG: TIR domain-containing protein [Rhodococcus sp. (in: high G+C Gram-positive bacteria)]|nr:MAG: TIR domain-containing protein [Rhodococcus sp. (in: high G+C Gram-positive bacteria)]
MQVSVRAADQAVGSYFMGAKRKVFISWSGSLCEGVADLVQKEVNRMFDVFDPFMSKNSIGLGKHNIANIFEELQNAEAGIFVLSKETQNRTWVNFEAGALSVKVGGSDAAQRRVIPLLVDFELKHLEGPLRSFQGKVLDKEGWGHLVETLAEMGEVEKNTALERMQSGQAAFFEKVADLKKRYAMAADTELPNPTEMFETVLGRMEESRSAIQSLGTDLEIWKNCQRNASMENIAGTLARTILGDSDARVAMRCVDGCYSKTGAEIIAFVDSTADVAEAQSVELESVLKDLGFDTVRIDDFSYDESDLDWN